MLYKYFPPERADFLQKRLLRFTQPGMFNDPFDMLPAIAGYDVKEVRELVDRNALIIAYEMGFQGFGDAEGKARMDALNRSSHELFKEYSSDPSRQGLRYLDCLRKRMNSQIGILSLCKNSRSILMWSHYAGEHTGFVVGFDSDAGFFSHQADEPTEIGQLRPVRYVKNRPAVDVDMIKNEQPIPDFLFSKNQEWSYEQEWRIVRFLKNADEISDQNIHLFKVPPTAIREVILGCHAQPNVEEGLSAGMKKNPDLSHVKFFKAALSRTQFEMDFLPWNVAQSLI